MYIQMHGCADGRIVYGWRDCSDENVIDREWLDDNDVRLFCTCQVKCYASGYPIYGLTCALNVNIGTSNIDEREIQKVQEAYAKFVTFYKKNGGNEEIMPKLGYYIAVDGDMEWDCYDIYMEIDSK
jgi:hypothetical protein